jgi:hypothetical protein
MFDDSRGTRFHEGRTVCHFHRKSDYPAGIGQLENSWLSA